MLTKRQLKNKTVVIEYEDGSKESMPAADFFAPFIDPERNKNFDALYAVMDAEFQMKMCQERK